MISVVVPVFNEEQALTHLFDRLAAAAETWNEPVEFLLVDDGSADATWQMIQDFHSRDPRWKGIRLGRNFGHQAAISAGLWHAVGDCVIVMDADLQDPPEEVGRFLQKWREGYHVVYAVRRQRKESLFKRVAYEAFYRILAGMSYVPIPLDAGDFSLMDRSVVDVLKAMPERNRFVRGLRSWVGLKQIGLPYERHARSAGEVKYTYWKLFKLAFDGIFSFSVVPLRIATVTGVFASLLSAIGAFFYFLTRVFHEFFQPLGFPLTPGFATIIIVVFFWAEFSSRALGLWENTLPEFTKKLRHAHFGPPWSCLA
jgi:polyisoprenyl-phosphate glycosyltransferase